MTSSDGQGGRELRGTWREDPLDSNGQLAREAKPSGGEVTLVMSEDGLSCGAARLGASADSELVEWRGDRIPRFGRAAGGGGARKHAAAAVGERRDGTKQPGEAAPEAAGRGDA